MLSVGGEQRLSCLPPHGSCQDNMGLQVFLGKLWGLRCREGDGVNCPSPNKIWRLLSFPCRFALRSSLTLLNILGKSSLCSMSSGAQMTHTSLFLSWPACLTSLLHRFCLLQLSGLDKSSSNSLFLHILPTSITNSRIWENLRAITQKPVSSLLQKQAKFWGGERQREEGRTNHLSPHDVHTCFPLTSLF